MAGAGASALIALAAHHFLLTSPQPVNLMPIEAAVRTNKKPTGTYLNWDQLVLKPPLLNTNWTHATLEFSSNLEQWSDVGHVTVSNPYIWIVYWSNFSTHVVTPVKTNYVSNCWNIIVTGAQAGFFRWKGY